MESDCPRIKDEDETSQGVIAVAVQSQSAAAAILQTNETDTAVDVDANTSTPQAVNLQEGDLLGIENLSRLTNLQTEDAIKFIASHIGQFHELVNQTSIKDRPLNVLIQVISNICSTSSNFDVQKHLIRIVTNQHFLKNILSYMRDSMAPRLYPVKYEAPRKVFYSTNKPYCTDNFTLSHLQTYFKFVEENLNDLGTTIKETFTDSFSFYEQLVGSSCDQNEEGQSSCASSEDDLASCSSRRISTSSLCETPANVNVDEDPVGIESLRNLLGKSHPEAIKFIDSHYIQFESLLNQTTISNPQLIALITFIGVKLCVQKCSLPDLRDKLFLAIANVNFVKNILKYTKRNLVARRIDSGLKLKSPSGGLKANGRATFAPKIVLKNLLKIFKFVEDNLIDSAPANFAECFNLLTQLERSCEDGKNDLQTSSATISVGHQVESESAINYVCNVNSAENQLGIQVLSTLLTKDSNEVISTVHDQLGELSKLVHKSITPSHLNILLQILVSKICTFVTAPRDQHVHVQQLQREILTIVSDSKFLRKLRKHLNKVASSILKCPKGQSIVPNETNENTPEMTLNYTALEVFESVWQYYYFLLMPKIQNEILLEFDLDLLEKNITSAREFLQQIKAQGKVSEFADQNPQAFHILQLSWNKLSTCMNQNLIKKRKAKKTKENKAVSPAVKLGPEIPSISAGNYFASASFGSSPLNKFENPLGIQFLSTLLTKDSGKVITIVHNQSGELANLISRSITDNHLNMLIQILGCKVCSVLEDADIKQLQKEIFLVVSNSKFLQKLKKFMTKLVKRSERSLDLIPGSSLANSATPNVLCPIQAFKNILSFYTFLVTTEIREVISLPIYEELVVHMKEIRQLLHSVQMSTGPLREVFLLNKSPKDLQGVQSSFKKLGSSLNVYLSTYKKCKSTTTASSSLPEIPDPIPTAKILSRGQNGTKPQQTTSILNIQSVNSTAHLFTVDHLIEMKQMPADQVFNLVCMERVYFKHFITETEILGNQLNLLISIIGSKLCNRTVFVHFQKYVFSMLLEKYFLKKIYNFTREIVSHINKQPPPPPYCSNSEIFANLFAFYNLLLIYCEDPPAQLKTNIRSVYGLLQNVIHNKNQLSVSTLTTLQRNADLFKALVASIIERTKMMMEATHKDESNLLNHPDVDKDADVPSPSVDADPLELNSLASLLKRSPSTVLEFLHERRSHLAELVSEPIIMDRRLNVLIQIVGSKVCGNPLLAVEVESAQMHTEVLQSVTTPVFLRMIFNYKNVLRNLVLSTCFDMVFRSQGKPPYCSAIDILAHAFQYYRCLLSIENNNTFKLPYSQLLMNINAAALVLNTVEAQGKISLFSNENPAVFTQLHDTAKFLQESFASNPELTLPLPALLELESITLAESTGQSPVPIPIPGPELEPECDLKSDLTMFLVTSSEPVSDTDTVMDVVDSLIFEIEMQELEITNYLGVPGFVKSVFFIDRDDETCENDEFRAEFLVALCRHVILQNYEASEVKVLVSGRARALLVKNMFAALENPFCSVDIGPLISYDGNESDVMILSLEGQNVKDVDKQFFNALYKARHGCYILGNKNHLLKSNPKLWTQFLSKLEDDESIGDKLELRCQIHKTDFCVRTSGDFRTKTADGGCRRPCDTPLEGCEHPCQKFCHVVDRNHEDYKCQILIDAKLKCGHMGNVECWRAKTKNQLDNSSIVCDSVCGAELDCGHVCFEKCHMFQNPGQETAGEHPPCPEIIQAKPPCNHMLEHVPCFQAISGEIKPSFQNEPSNKCTVEIKVKLPCGYEYMEKCEALRSPNYINRTCESLCMIACARGHPCGRVHKCCVGCEPCEGRVSHVLPCGHTVSNVACPSEIPTLECSYKSCKKDSCIIS